MIGNSMKNYNAGIKWCKGGSLKRTTKRSFARVLTKRVFNILGTDQVDVATWREKCLECIHGGIRC